MQQNRVLLRVYARRVIVEENTRLDLLEDVKTALVDELWESCKAFELTERDTAVIVFKGILP